ncbi:unnamed protein product [Bursaphelenchus xylophilus]|uniref:(pine wood nematode) hypothetical protein n=1 Tax=Bursaphelenchus xylophilus TaxID=6326 RepID=A0A1I7RYC9_BURXY|nr:unnamed protein product [Bursaphelenchus xylophilus]CAG9085605.1 unnamed protein product [Bursaphelenchus xylophilus]
MIEQVNNTSRSQDLILGDNGCLLGSINDSVNSTADKERHLGRILLSIPESCCSKQKASSPFYYFGGFPWRLSAKLECSARTSNTNHFSVYVDCNPESQSTLWSCDAVIDIRLLSKKADTNCYTKKFTNKFSLNSNNWGFPAFLEWNTVRDPKNGFIQDGVIELEALIDIRNCMGVREFPEFDFTSSTHLTNMVLLVEGRPLFVNKDYLSLYSPVFDSLFNQNFLEKNQEKIELHDLKYDEFKELLEVVYPSHKKLNAENIEYILILADRFQIDYVIRKCEKFLIKTTEISAELKLVYADRYGFPQLQHHCMSEFKTTDEMKRLKKSEEYRSLSDKTKAALLEKMFKLL